MTLDIRVGQGFDVHRVGTDPARALVLGGCRFPGPGLVGHSDGDAVAHAITDALLGASGSGEDIGQRFPDTDPSLEGADSVELLRRVAADVRAAGWRVGNADCSVICEAPRLAPMRAEMEDRLSEALGAPVSVKGRRPEGLGALGRGEGVACFASVVLIRGDA